jgi:hypothetical protein
MSSIYGKKVVAVLDTQSNFGVAFQTLRNNVTSLLAGQQSIVVATTQPTSPSEGQLWFDKNSLTMKIYINDGTSSQWVEI